MKDPTHVRGVNAHAKRAGARQHLNFAVKPPSLSFLLFLCREPGVKCGCPQPGLFEPLGPPFTFVTRLNVHQALPLLFCCVVQQDGVSVAPKCHFVSKVGTTHRCAVHLKIQRELGGNVVQNFGCRRGGECAPYCFGKRRFQRTDLLESRAEVMPPLGDAMDLVDHDRGDLPILESRQEHGVVQSFRREVQELSRAKPDVVQNPVSVGADPSLCTKSHFAEGLALIFHQRNQRSNDQAKAASGEGRQLEANAFPTSGRQKREGVSTCRQVQHRAHLMRPKLVVPPMLFEQGQEVFRDDVGRILR